MRKAEGRQEDARQEKLRQALSPVAEPELLAELAKDEDPMVREAVAGNPLAPAQALEVLARDAVAPVRAAVASNTLRQFWRSLQTTNMLRYASPQP